MSLLTRRLDKIEAKINIVQASSPLSASDTQTFRFTDDVPSLQDLQKWCLAAMNDTSRTIYNDIDYSQGVAASEPAIAEPPVAPKPEPEIPDNIINDIADRIPLEPVGTNIPSWASGEPRQAEHYEEY